MKKRGCEIEAKGINYKIGNPSRGGHHIGKLFGRGDAKEAGDAESGGNIGKVRDVLKDVNCQAKPWEILAVVGPSGAGKSSLLEILARMVRPSSGSIFVNGKPMDKSHFRKITGYVTQKDTLFPLLTVEETLMFSAKLRLRLPATKLALRVKSLIEELGLSHVCGTRVGNDCSIRGVSGGERRRVSIGVDVVHDPRVLILDEPTSGLDSNSALQIIGMLKEMAETKGRTVILSIHQPGFRIVKLFNSVLLMAHGEALHQGSTDQLTLHLRSVGLQIPPHINVVEFAIESIETIKQQQLSHSSERARLEVVPRVTSKQEGESGSGKFTLQQLFQQSKVVDEGTIEVGADHDQTCGFANSRLKETLILTHRFSKNIFRTKELFAYRTVQILASGLMLGSIFHGLKENLIGAQERVGLFAFILTFLLTSSIEALPIFLQEREILMKETSSGSYRVSSYAIANGLVYLPFLLILAVLFTVPLYWLVGLNHNLMAFLHFLLFVWLILYTANSVVVCFSALVPNFIVGNSVISGVMGSFFLFSGYFITKQEIPKYWIFMHYISLFKYPFEGFLINEFSRSGKCLQYMFGTCMVTGEDVLREEGFREESQWRNVVIMVCYILVYRFISYVILRIRCSQRGFRGATA
ncbi:ABC transporter G family member 5 [Punica granatum]|uniref:ABC transporter domain-containing protein n=2 Tax=Punica granatum TaxID=22663 RepID=A0A218WU32_PUNGR|nr:ABC transporter G family member 5 [Punica granatum]OWM76364.1 hypothetical protein CDL15_Pgr028234 [Punica granatum]PKI34150.1 hypothetical protein CRG98_045429 [Punica granatum]